MSSFLPSDFLFSSYTKVPSSILPIHRLRNSIHSQALHQPFDRVNVLGDDHEYGHRGCVNAVSWAENGNLLLTGGDDRTVRLWRVDPSNLKQEYPYVCRSVISTGHRSNIFNVQMLPYSNRIVTCAADKDIRVFDAATAVEAREGLETQFSARQTCIGRIRCHTGRVKKIVTEDSPDVFLSLSEDGTVRQHDLRTSHICHAGTCPAPLLRTPHELSTLSMSPIKPYQIIVAGDSPYGYLYDRRHIGRVLEEEWGAPPSIGEDVTTCVRRFGRPPKVGTSYRERRPHITGSRISHTNGDEVLLSYSSDKIYLFSTRDEPHNRDSFMSTAASSLSLSPDSPKPENGSTRPAGFPVSVEDIGRDDGDRSQVDDDEEDDEYALLNFLSGGENASSDLNGEFLSDIPIVFPRNEYSGPCNVETFKDVNFLGPYDEHVVSGSDDGNWFMWNKYTGILEGIYEGDSSVVNVLEGHPHLPLVAVSGIDTTVKLFSPTRGKSQFSRIDNAERIMEMNAELSRRRPVAFSLGSLLAEVALNAGGGSGDGGCPTQ